jgi:hypothetical protein
LRFEIVSPIADVETIAVGAGVDVARRLRRLYGGWKWRKRKGVAWVRLSNGETCLAELHWYEAHGIGKRDFKIKRVFEEA